MQGSCADVNSPFKQKCWTNSRGLKVNSLLWAVLRTHDILGWIRIRIRGSMPLTNGSGSGSCYFRHWASRCQQKNNFFTQFFLLITLLHLHHFSKILCQKKSQNSRNQGFSYYFCMMIEGSGSGARAGSGSGSIPLTSGSGSGSGRPKNKWIWWIRIRIQIRIRNTDSELGPQEGGGNRHSSRLPPPTPWGGVTTKTQWISWERVSWSPGII